MPLEKDSVKSSLYASGTVSSCNTNESMHDKIFAIQANIYNVSQTHYFKGWYGGGFTLGNYKVSRVDDLNYPDFDVNAIDSLAGNKFFGTLNLDFGGAIVLPFRRGGEWRVLEFTTSLQNEFGSYLQFRKTLQNNSIKVNGNVPHSFLATIGFGTEFTFKIRNGSLGFKDQYNILLGKDYSHIDPIDYSIVNNYPPEGYKYMSFEYQLTLKNYTGFFQQNMGPTVASFQVGLNYRINSRPLKRKININTVQ